MLPWRSGGLTFLFKFHCDLCRSHAILPQHVSRDGPGTSDFPEHRPVPLRQTDPRLALPPFPSPGTPGQQVGILYAQLSSAPSSGEAFLTRHFTGCLSFLVLVTLPPFTFTVRLSCCSCGSALWFCFTETAVTAFSLHSEIFSRNLSLF